MSEEISLADVITEAVSAYLAEADEPAMLNGFVFACSALDAEGGTNLRIANPLSQGYHETLGMIGFAEECVRYDIRDALAEDAG